MKNLLVMLVVMLALACQAAAANTVMESHQPSVVSAFLAEPYLAALLSLILLIATLIWNTNIIGSWNKLLFIIVIENLDLGSLFLFLRKISGFIFVLVTQKL